MNKTEVVITGFGVISCLGRGPEENRDALRAGKSGIVSQRPEWSDHRLRSHVAGKIDVDPYRGMFDRKRSRFFSDIALLGAVGLQDAIEHAGLSEEEVRHPRTGLIMGSGAGSSVPDTIELGERLRRRGGARVGTHFVPRIMGSALSANLGSLFGIRGHSYSVTSACSTSAHAIMLGMDLIRSGRQDRVFAGGAEDVNVYAAACFDGMNALSSAFNDEPERASRPLDKGRDGFVISGGAGVVVLENRETAFNRDARVHAVLKGAAATCDGSDMVAPNGIGAESVMRLALEDAGIPASTVDYINLHGTSTPVGDVVELEAIQSVFGEDVPPLSSTKSMTGHGLGASGVQEAIYCLLMMNDGFIAPNINLDDPEPLAERLPVVREARDAELSWVLSNSFGFGGTNCALVMSNPGR